MYIADTYNQCIRKVTVATGIITTIVGTGASSYSGDNGPATSAELNYPCSIAIDTSGNSTVQYLWYTGYNLHPLAQLGNVYVADYGNHRIRKVTVATGIISTVAGTGVASYSGNNGPATSAALNYPRGVELDSSGTPSLLYLEHRVN